MTIPILHLETGTPTLESYVPFGDVSAQQPRKCTVQKLYDLIQPPAVLSQVVVITDDDATISVTCRDTTRDLWLIFDSRAVTGAAITSIDVDLTLPTAPINNQEILFSFYGSWDEIAQINLVGDFVDVIGTIANGVRYFNSIKSYGRTSGRIVYNETYSAWFMKSGFDIGSLIP